MKYEFMMFFYEAFGYTDFSKGGQIGWRYLEQRCII